MFVFLLQLRAWMHGYSHDFYLFAVFTALVWGLWSLKMILSRRYRPWTEPHHTTTSVVVPVVDEPLDLFRDVLTRVAEQGPDELIVVINGPRNTGLEDVVAEIAGATCVWTPIPGKRNAVKMGVARATGDIVLLLDSDTIWTTGVLTEVVKPFADPGIGGVTTRQRILDPHRSFLTRWADWLENSRSLYSMPAQSAVGQVGCLPGRTIAFRRHVLAQVMDAFMHEEFLGVFLEVSDDRTLTNLTLKAGYRTVYQHTALVYTDAPTKIRKLAKQQLRWARGSQYNTLRMLPWMTSHAPVLAVFFLADIVLPFLLAGAAIGWCWRSRTGQGYNYFKPVLEAVPGYQGWLLVLAAVVGSSWLSMVIRQMRHLDEKPGDVLLLPAFILFSTLFLMPIRLWGFFRMAHVAGWGTRSNAYAKGQQVSDEQTETEDLDRELDDLMAAGNGHQTGAATLAEPRTAPLVSVVAPARRRFNSRAGIPYAIGFGLLALEALVYV